MNIIRQCWAESRTYRILLIAAIVYAGFRLVIQIYLFSDALQPEVIAQGGQVGTDLQRSYIPAAQHFRAQEDLYLSGSLEILELYFQYSPAFAFFFGPLLLLPLKLLVPLLVLLHIAAYWLFYVWWHRIFQRNNIEKATKMWAWILPLFLVFSVFWDDLAYMNIYLITALFATLLIDAILQENLRWSIFWIAVILPIKPQWAFAAALPVLLGRNRFFLKLIAGTIITYLLIAAITILAGGVSYGIQQYKDYFEFLGRLSRDFPWRGPERPFLGYNHSVVQIILYYFGVSPTNMHIATILKLVLLAPLGWVGFKFLRSSQGKPPSEIPETAIALAFALYLGAFIWLDMVWELTLGIVIFTYLLATTEEKWLKTLSCFLFAPYALLDVWRLTSYIIFGDRILYEGAYVLTDPIIYVPWIMITLLVMYILLLKKLTVFSTTPV